MTFLLDTNTVIYYLRGVAPVVKRVQAHKPRDLAISAVTVMELLYGAARRQAPRLTAAIDAVLKARARFTYAPVDRHLVGVPDRRGERGIVAELHRAQR